MAQDDDDDNLPPIDLAALDRADGLDYREQLVLPEADDSGLAWQVADLRNQLAAAVSLIRRLEEQVIPRVAAATTGGNACVVKITGNASGGGKYTGRVLTGTSTAVATGTLSMPEGMTTPAADDALILNGYENGVATHDLSANTYHPGVIVADSGGTKTVYIEALPVNPCGP